MRQYLDLLSKVRNEGELRPNRTGVNTYSIFGYQLRHDLGKGFPLLTTKKIHFPSVAHELLWFIKGETNIKYLNDNKISIWDEWADERGELGPVYGKQWRSWGTPQGRQIDQLKELIRGLKQDPDSRRHIISAWNPADLPDMALAPCHILFQFYVAERDDGKTLSCHLYQRSADLFLGVPFNIASYSLLTMMLASCLGMRPGEFIHSFGDVHIYENHLTQADEQLSRTELALPQIKLNPKVTDLFSFGYEDIQLVNYHPHSLIKAEVAV